MQSIEHWAKWAKDRLKSHHWQEFEDTGTGIYRAANFDQQDHLSALICVARSFDERTLPSRGWLGSLMAKGMQAPLESDARMALLSGLPTVGTEDVGATICACFNVGEKTILKAIEQHQLTTYQEVGQCCQAGTNCGSCVPEVKALIKACKG